MSTLKAVIRNYKLFQSSTYIIFRSALVSKFSVDDIQAMIGLKNNKHVIKASFR